ncbi:MAG: methyltransferase domain-containing protein [Verrucomicrobia bacterium]|nr:methyltransferase domain-containing protein [Verrucomicrobiota bacterium]
MNSLLPEIARSFDTRAENYSRGEWHRRYAERLVTLARVRPGQHVLDVGTGTGFAALAAARIVGPAGHVLGIDISPGMLRHAAAAGRAAGLANLEFLEGDAVHLGPAVAANFDVVLCASALLYMPAAEALREWHRVLRPGGRIAFSTMQAGSPLPAQLFRDCAAEFGVTLTDPSEPLGSVAACRQALEAAGFNLETVVAENVDFMSEDLALAWEANYRSPANIAVHRLGLEDQRALEKLYREELDRLAREEPVRLKQVHALYALGRK